MGLKVPKFQPSNHMVDYLGNQPPLGVCGWYKCHLINITKTPLSLSSFGKFQKLGVLYQKWDKYQIYISYYRSQYHICQSPLVCLINSNYYFKHWAMFLPQEIHADLQQDKVGSMLLGIPIRWLICFHYSFFPCFNDVLIKTPLL